MVILVTVWWKGGWLCTCEDLEEVLIFFRDYSIAVLAGFLDFAYDHLTNLLRVGFCFLWCLLVILVDCFSFCDAGGLWGGH